MDSSETGPLLPTPVAAAGTEDGSKKPSCCQRLCFCCCGCCCCLLVLIIIMVTILHFIPTDVFPSEVRALLDVSPGYGSWTNLLLALGGVLQDMSARYLQHCPASRGIQEDVRSECIVNADKLAKFKWEVSADLNAGKERLPPVCGINAFNPRRLNKKWSHDAGLKFDNKGGPNSPCGTMIFGSVDNLPTENVTGGPNSTVDLTGLFWMHNNIATQYIGEQLLTFGDSKSTPLSDKEIAFFEGRDQGLLKFKGVKKAVPDFKVILNPVDNDARWSYDDRCISSDGIMRVESNMGANGFTFYFWHNPEGSPSSPIYGEIDRNDWATEDVWTFEPQSAATFSAKRGIYTPLSTEPIGASYEVLKVLTAEGEPVINKEGGDQWAKFLAFLDKWCITSLFTWKSDCQCKRYCGITQLNTVQGGCQSIEWNGIFPSFTPTQAEANATAHECCECTQCE